METYTEGRTALMGTVVAGRYRLGTRLGSGGMGEVFRAFDQVDQRDVAVKRLPVMGDNAAVRIRREIRAMEALALPGVVRLVDEMEEGGWQFIVMELLEGQPFPGQHLPMDWDTLAPVAEGLLETLARVHEAGVVHRDLKPDNVLVDDLGRPTILDFGLAKGHGLGATVTKSGMFAGTPAYAAPEQLRGERPDARADLFAVGVMLFAALTGERPDGTSNIDQVITARLTRQLPPMHDLVPDLPAHVAQAVDRLVSMEPDDRFDTAVEALRALRGGATRRGARLPWVGGDAVLANLVERVRAGGRVVLGGGSGAGKTRMLHALGERLVADGREVGQLPRGERPFESLRRWIDEPAASSGGLSEAVAAWASHVAAWLEVGGVLLVDGLDLLDRYSRRVLDALPSTASVVITGPATGADVVLAPWTDGDLRDLFHGPDVILHLREDGAAELLRRTQGVPARVTSEVGAWVRAGLARWEDDKLRVSRGELDALRSGLALAPSGVESRELDHPLRPDQELFLAWVALAGMRAEVPVLASAMGRDRYEVEAWVEELTDLGALRVDDDHLALRVPARGLFRWDATRRALAHHALAHALPSGDPERLRHLVLSARWAERSMSGLVSRPSSDVDTMDGVGKIAQTLDGSMGELGFRDEDAELAAIEAVGLAERRVFDGQVGAALAALRLALPLVRDLGRDRDVARVLRAWAYVALEDLSVEGVREVLHAFERSPAAKTLPEFALVCAALAAFEGRAEQAMRVLMDVPPQDLAFERERHGIRFRAARYLSVDAEAALLEELSGWSAEGGETAARAIASWRGLHLYRRGDFHGAAEAHASSFDPTVRRASQMGVLLNEASARLEATEVDTAHERAAVALEMAIEGRHTFFEARAMWLVRSARYRRAEVLRSDAALVAAAEQLGTPSLMGVLSLTEAAIAWRAKDASTASHLARVAMKAFSSVGQRQPEMLCAALLCAVEQDVVAATALWREVLSCQAPRVGLQVMGVLTDVLPASAAAAVCATDWLAKLEPETRGARREVLSGEEALARVHASIG